MSGPGALCAIMMMAVLLCSTFAPGAHADCPNPGGNPNNPCAHQPAAQSANGPDAGAGNPIDVRTGNKYQREVDLSPLPGVLPIEIVRHYNSQSKHNGSFGYGWSHSFEASLFVSKTDIQIRQSDGRRIHFAHVGRPSGRQPVVGLTPDPQTPPTSSLPRKGSTNHSLPFKGRVGERMGEDEPTTTLTARNPNDGAVTVTQQGYNWHWRSGRTLAFDSQGKLIAITDPDGHTIKLSYDRDNQLFEITDSQSRKLTFGYYPNHRVKLIVDPGGQTYRYAYDAHGNLESVNYPDGTTRKYHYEDKCDPHNLTGITNERGLRYSTYAYDEKDRGVLSTHAADVDKVTLKYEAHATILTNSFGQTTRYQLDSEERILNAQGPGCSTCGETNVTYRYNASGQLARITRPTTTTEMEYDSQGRLIRTLEILDAPAGKPKPRRDTRYEYGDPRHPFLATLTSRSSRIKGRARTTEVRYNEQGQALEVLETIPGGSHYRKIGPDEERRTLYQYDNENRLVAIDGPLAGGNGKARYEYGDDGLTTLERRPDGVVYRVKRRDAWGRAAEATIERPWLPTPRHYVYTYDRFGSVRSVSFHGTTVRYGAKRSPTDIAIEKALAKQTGEVSGKPVDDPPDPNDPTPLDPQQPQEPQAKVGPVSFLLHTLARGFAADALAAVQDPQTLARGQPVENISGPATDLGQLEGLLEGNDSTFTNTGSEQPLFSPIPQPGGTPLACTVNNEAACKEIGEGLDYATVAACVYDGAAACTGETATVWQEEWEVLSLSEINTVFGTQFTETNFDEGSFHAYIVRDKTSDEYVLAFRGTDNLGDWWDNVAQSQGVTTEQYKKAIDLAKELKNKLSADTTINVTGHSLGGGLATAAALVFRGDADAFVFNAAGLHPEVAKDNRLEYGLADGIVTNYTVEGEIVTTVQGWDPGIGPIELDLAPEAPGKQVTLAPPADADVEEPDDGTLGTWFKNALAWVAQPLTWAPRATNLHYMTTVIASLKQRWDALGCDKLQYPDGLENVA